MPMDVMNKVYAKHFEFGNTPARATIKVASLPNGANIEFTGVAIRDLSKRQAVRPKNMPPSPTASPACSPMTRSTAPPSPDLSRAEQRNLRFDGRDSGPADHAQSARWTRRSGLDLRRRRCDECVSRRHQRLREDEQDYAQYFSGAPPTRTTVQQFPPAERKANDQDRWPTLEQISLIAVK